MTNFPGRAAQARTILEAALVLILATTVTNLEFSAVAAAVPGQTQTSNVVTIAGLGAGVVVPVVASAGMTIIENGVAVAGQSTTAKNGDTIAVRIAPLGYGQTSDLTLSVGSSSTQWDVTSMPLGGSISGLTGTGLKLQVNLGDSVAVSPGATSCRAHCIGQNLQRQCELAAWISAPVLRRQRRLRYRGNRNSQHQRGLHRPRRRCLYRQFRIILD